jgi:UDP-sulfoquinovose synthase
VAINHLPNPRVEAEQHYYNPRHRKLLDLGLQPRLLSDVLVDSMLVTIRDHADRIRHDVILPHVKWDGAFEGAVKAYASVS